MNSFFMVLKTETVRGYYICIKRKVTCILNIVLVDRSNNTKYKIIKYDFYTKK